MSGSSQASHARRAPGAAAKARASFVRARLPRSLGAAAPGHQPGIESEASLHDVRGRARITALEPRLDESLESSPHGDVRGIDGLMQAQGGDQQGRHRPPAVHIVQSAGNDAERIGEGRLGPVGARLQQADVHGEQLGGRDLRFPIPADGTGTLECRARAGGIAEGESRFAADAEDGRQGLLSAAAVHERECTSHPPLGLGPLAPQRRQGRERGFELGMRLRSLAERMLEEHSEGVRGLVEQAGALCRERAVDRGDQHGLARGAQELEQLLCPRIRGACLRGAPEPDQRVAQRLDERGLGHGLPRAPGMRGMVREARGRRFETGPDIIQRNHRVRRPRGLGDRSIAGLPLRHPRVRRGAVGPEERDPGEVRQEMPPRHIEEHAEGRLAVRRAAQGERGLAVGGRLRPPPEAVKRIGAGISRPELEQRPLCRCGAAPGELLDRGVSDRESLGRVTTNAPVMNCQAVAERDAAAKLAFTLERGREVGRP
jgi:hypothetical protein